MRIVLITLLIVLFAQVGFALPTVIMDVEKPEFDLPDDIVVTADNFLLDILQKDPQVSTSNLIKMTVPGTLTEVNEKF